MADYGNCALGGGSDETASSMAGETDARVTVSTAHRAGVAGCSWFTLFDFFSLCSFFDGNGFDPVLALLKLLMEQASPADAVGCSVLPSLYRCPGPSCRVCRHL